MQTKKHSWIEGFTNSGIGTVVSCILWKGILEPLQPILGWDLGALALVPLLLVNLFMGTTMACKTYVIRRLFNAWAIRHHLSKNNE